MTTAIRLFFHRRIGHLFHYGHLIVDAILPFIPIYREISVLYPSGIEIICIDRMDQHTSQFANFWSFFFPKILHIRYVSEHEFYSVYKDVPVYQVHGYQFGPYPKEELMYTEQQLHWSKIEQAEPIVLLIERGHAVLRLVPSIRANARDTGAKRRCLTNQKEVEHCVQHFCAVKNYRLVVAQLEEMSIEQQQYLFSNAFIIIGQHGAGLCNLIFATRGKCHVFEISHWGLNTIRNLAQSKDCHHHIVNSSMNWCDTNDLRCQLYNIP